MLLLLNGAQTGSNGWLLPSKSMRSIKRSLQISLLASQTPSSCRLGLRNCRQFAAAVCASSSQKLPRSLRSVCHILTTLILSKSDRPVEISTSTHLEFIIKRFILQNKIYNKVSELIHNFRHKRQAPYMIFPEILVIVDYDGYRWFGQDIKMDGTQI